MIRLDFAVTLRQGVFTLEVADAASVEVLGVFGPSGSGKTSLLEVIAGLRTPDTGHVRVADRLLLSTEQRVNVPPHHRQVGYVPQDVALFPHLDVRGNLLYGAPSAPVSRSTTPDSRLPTPDTIWNRSAPCSRSPTWSIAASRTSLAASASGWPSGGR